MQPNNPYEDLPEWPTEIFMCRCVVNPFASAFKIVPPQIAAHSELWHLMELRVQNSYAPIRHIDWVCGYDEIAMLSNASKSNGVFEIAYLAGVEEWRN